MVWIINEYNIYLHLGDYTYLKDTLNSDNYPITRFLSETGVESMPSLETWQQITDISEDWDFISTLVENREHHPFGQLEMKFDLKIILFLIRLF